MTELLESSALGNILHSCVPNDNKEAHKKLCCLYLNDYILSAYRPSMVDEKQVIYYNQSLINYCTKYLIFKYM